MAAREHDKRSGSRDVLLQRFRAAVVGGGNDIAQPEIDRLAAFLPHAAEVDQEVLAVLAAFYWTRAQRDSDPEGSSGARALLLLLAIFVDHPSAVSTEVSEMLVAGYGHPELLAKGDRDALRGFALLEIATEFGQPGMLDPGIDSLERAALSGALGDRAGVLDSLGSALCARSDERARTGAGPDAADLARAAECFRTAYQLSDPTDPTRSERQARWGAVLVNDATDIDASATGVQLLSQAIVAMSAGEQRRYPLTALSRRLALDVPFPLPADTVEVACAAVDRAVATARPIDDDRQQLLDARFAAAGALYARDDRTAVDRAIALSRDAFDPSVPRAWLNGLAELLRAMCATPSPALVDAAIEVYRHLIHTRPEVDHDLDVDLAGLLRTGHRMGSGLQRLQQAGAILRRVLRATDRNSATYVSARSLLAVVLSDLAGFTGKTEDIELAIEAARIVATASGPADSAAPALNNLALLLRLKHERTGVGLDEAIVTMRRALALDDADADPATHAERLGNLAVMLALDGQFEAATAAADEAVLRAPGGEADVHAARTTVRRLVHDRRGGEADLDAMITSLRSLVESAPDPVAGAIRRGDLGAALRKRYTETGDSAALAEAITAYRQALRFLPADHRHRDTTLANLMVSLLEQARRTEDPAELGQAIVTGREVVAATPADSPALRFRLTNLSRLLTYRFRHDQDRQFLDEAIELDQRAIEITPADDPQRGMRLNNLAASLLLLADASGDRGAMSMAVTAARHAVAATDTEHPQLGSRLANLAEILEADAALGGRHSRRTLREAQRVAGQAAQLPTSTPSTRRLAYRVLGECAAAEGQWARAAEAFAEAVRQLPLIASRNLRRGDAEHRLAQVRAVHMDAAACAAQAGDADAALTSLEQGRGVLLAYALDARTELTDLQEADPDLAAEVQRLLDEIGKVDDPSGSSEQRHRLRARWDDVLHQVRARPGFEQFAAAPTMESLLPVGRPGPVVVVNVSRYRCDALIVLPTGVRMVPLPRLSADEVAARARAFVQAVESTATGDTAHRARSEAEIRDSCGWLWDSVAEPVLNELGFRGPLNENAGWPHVWWSPTGMLQFLPLHAAGHHDRPGRSVLDRAVSSYTPTLRALQHARSRRPGVRRELVSVAMSQTRGHDALPATVAEANSVVATSRLSRMLADDAATVDEVTAALRQCPMAHFACHAVTDLRSPSENRLLLHDGSLTVRDISRLRLPDAEFAFLSACSTARGDERLADESIHLVSAFQLAGYRHVVGTLWPIADSAAARVTRQFYAHRRTLPPAAALHAVVRQLRARAPERPSTWAAHVHSGP